MSAKSAGHAIQQFVVKVQSSNITGKQNELKGIINGPLALAREKGEILETDEAQSVLSRIDLIYKADLKENVIRIFNEEVESGTILLEEIDAIISELQILLETALQRIQNEKRKQQLSPDNLQAIFNQYEDSRGILIYLKLRTESLRLRLAIPFDEPSPKIAQNIEGDIEDGNFLLRLSKLETSCLMAV